MNVTMYTTPTCTYCKATKQFFADNNIAYNEIDVAAKPDEARKMIEKSGQMGVPVITIERDGKEEIVIGFDKPKLMQLLNIAA